MIGRFASVLLRRLIRPAQELHLRRPLLNTPTRRTFGLAAAVSGGLFLTSPFVLSVCAAEAKTSVTIKQEDLIDGVVVDGSENKICINVASDENSTTISCNVNDNEEASLVITKESVNTGSWSRNMSLEEVVSITARALQLLWIFLPTMVMAPLALVNPRDWESAWWETLVSAFEEAGPTFIKFGQWASTRPDVFPPKLCQELRRLQTAVRPHPYFCTEQMFFEAFGLKISEVFDEFELHPVGSGCIAQVYRAKLNPAVLERFEKEEDAAARAAGSDIRIKTKLKSNVVAVKVCHPNVTKKIAQDLAIAYTIAHVLTMLPTMKWLSLDETVGDFSYHMEKQLDMTSEARNLDRFRYNFRSDTHIEFPSPLWPLVSSNILTESFCEGEPVFNFISQKNPLNPQIASVGLEAFLKMILHHNFVHADLHPGNILVNLSESNKPKVVFLDVGLTCELSPNDRKNFLALFTAFIKGDGRKGASLMVENAREQECTDLEGFQEKMQSIFDRVVALRLQDLDIGIYLAEVLETVRRHRVKIESNFATLITAIIVAEGLGRGLDANVSIFTRAMPFILTDAELRSAAWKGVKERITTSLPRAVK